MIDVHYTDGALYLRVGDRAVAVPRLLPKDFALEASREWRHRHWPLVAMQMQAINGGRR